MSISYFSGTVLFLTAWIVYAWVKNEVTWLRLRRFGRKHGCEEPKVLKNQLPGGIERYWGMLKFKKGMDILEDHVRARHLKMGVGTYRIFNPFHSLISTSDPQNMQAILATNFTDFELGPSRSQNMFELLGNGIFTADGEAWAHYRQQLKPQFSRDQISDLEAADHHLQILYRALPQTSSEEVDLLPLLLRFTMDVSTEFLFGKSVNSQTTALQSIDSGNNTELQAEEKFVQAMSYSQDYIIFRVKLFKLWWLARSQKFLDACQICKDYSADFVQRALSSTSPKSASPNTSPPAPNPEKEEKYILLNALATQTRNPTELRDQMLHLLLAGRDTTAALLAWTLLLLSRNPARYTKYRSIILAHFGPLSSSSPLSFTTLKTCKTLTHILYETLRLYPIVPMNSRVATRDTVLPVGGGSDGKKPIVVRRGERIAYSTYVMHRRGDIWGEDALEWKPERWEGRRLGWEFGGFSGGARVCIGQQYALNEASFVIARFLQKYERIEAVDMNGEDGMLGKKLSLTMSPYEVRVRLFAAGE
ncbi:uncharacterized protein EAE98_000511 [Botrytis deweyae]|uniref:Cytochrome P450 n=1 Tax=Botrytis deweyae TaxID=2478750 RepID=A0ABQ7J2X8_9HELO|nr:uncharacterized protein EAE98_000511 [Botrytis deweyae]KAF7940384.1 hypothetical protein EAE98_000511 [Botrytis deweyae]